MSNIQRTRTGITLYFLLALFSFTQSMTSPLVPYLRQEFHLDYTTASFHITFFSIGMVLIGFLAPKLFHKLPLGKGLWIGMFGAALSFLLFILAPSPLFTFSAILLMSMFATMTLSATQTGITREFPLHRSQALMEANMSASLASALPPFLLILGAYTFLGWRIIFPFFILGIILVGILGFKKTYVLNDQSHETTEKDIPGPLPKESWIMFFLIILGVSVEWCVGFWSAEYLKGLPEHSLAVATAGTGIYQLACVAGRFISSKITQRWGERKIIAVALLLILIGFPLYWTRSNMFAAYLGLIFCGFGVCTFYPLILSLFISSAKGKVKKASSYAAIASGLAIGCAPLLLGRLSDAFSLSMALLAIPIGVFLMIIGFGIEKLLRHQRSAA